MFLLSCFLFRFRGYNLNGGQVLLMLFGNFGMQVHDGKSFLIETGDVANHIHAITLLRFCVNFNYRLV